MKKYFNKIGFRRLDQAVFIDIESATTLPEIKKGTPEYDSWAYKWKNDLELDTPEKLNEKYKKDGALYSFCSKVVNISMGYISGDKLKIKSYQGEEKGLLEEFFGDVTALERIGKKFVVTFSGNGYDIPFIYFRSLVNGIQPHHLYDIGGLKPWNLEHSIDLNELLRGTSYSNLSLVNACIAFGLPSPKEIMNGGEVNALYHSKKKDKMEKISTYCEHDVLSIANILCTVMGNNLVSL